MSNPMRGRLFSRAFLAILVVLGTGHVQFASPAVAGTLTLTSATDTGSFGLYQTGSASNGSPSFNSSGMMTSTGSSLFPTLGNVVGTLQTFRYSSSSPPSTYTNTATANPAVLPTGFGSSSITGTAAVLLPNSGSEGTDVTKTGVAYGSGSFLQSGATIPSNTVAVSFSQITANFSYSTTGTAFTGSVGAVLSANAYLGGQPGSFVALAENGTITIDNSGTLTTDKFQLVAAYGVGQSSTYQAGTGTMSSTGPNSQGEVTITGNTTTNLFPTATLNNGDSFTVVANLTLYSDPSSLIEFGSLSDVAGPLPTIGVFGGSAAVPEPSSLIELSAGMLIMACFWIRRKARSRKLDRSCRNSRPALCPALVPGCLCVLLSLSGVLTARAGTIEINDAIQPMSIAALGFSSNSTSNNSTTQQATFTGSYLSNDLLLTPNQTVTYDLVFQVPSPTGADPVDSASTVVTITGLNDSSSDPNTSVTVSFKGILSGPISPAPGVYFIAEPVGPFDVTAFLRDHKAADVPGDLSVIVTVASVPEPASLILGELAAVIGLGAVVLGRGRFSTAGKMLSDRSPLPKK